MLRAILAFLLMIGTAHAQSVLSPGQGGTGNNNSGAVSGDLPVIGSGGALGDSGYPPSGMPVTPTIGTATRTIGNQFADVLNVKDFGALGNGSISTALVTTSAASSVLTVGSATFAATDVGKWAIVGNAGTATATAPVVGIPTTSPGAGYTSTPACSISDSSSTGTGATCAAMMALQSAALVSGGAGCPNGTLTFWVIQAGNLSVAQITGTVTGGVLAGPLVVSVAGQYPVVPSVLSAATVTNGGCTTQPTVNLSFGVGFVSVTNLGATYTPSTTTAALSGGSPSTAATIGTPVVGIVVPPWIGQITSYTSPTQVTLSTPAGSTLSGLSTQLFFGNDDSAAIQATMNAGNSFGKDVYAPAGVYYIGAASLNPGAGPLTVRGAGMNATVFFWDPGTDSTYGDVAGGWRPLLTNINAATTPNSLEIEDIQFRGTYNFGRMNIGAAAIVINNYGEVIMDRIKMYEIPNMATQCESILRVRVSDSTFDTVMRDQVRFRSSFYVLVNGNHFSHSDDDSVALHQASYIQGAGNVREGMIVTNNFFEDTTGVHLLGARNAIVEGNIFSRIKVQAVNIAPDSSEGVNPLYNITVANNIATDSLNRPLLGGTVAAVFQVITQAPAASTANPSVTPGAQIAGTNYFNPPWNSYLNNVYTGTGGAPPTFGIDIHDNTTLRTLPSTANYSAWGFGTIMTDYGFIDPPVTDAALIPTAGILISPWGLGLNVHHNNIFNNRRGVEISGTQLYAAMSIISIDHNTIFDAWEAGIYDISGTNNKTSFKVTDNDITVDPYSISPYRLSTHGAWQNAPGSGYCIYTGDGGATFIEDNLMKECYQATNITISERSSRNWVFGSPYSGFTTFLTANSSANYGMGAYPYLGEGFDLTNIVADPSGNANSYNFGSLSAAHPTESLALPTAQSYKYGEFVRSLDPVSCTCFGWLRIDSTSANNVLGTDWKVVPIQ